MNGIQTRALELGGDVRLREECTCFRMVGQWDADCFHDWCTIRTIYSQRVSHVAYKTEYPVITALLENRRGHIRAFAIQELTLNDT